MNTERDKFLTKAMGECWHECDWGQTICKHCGRTNDPRYFDFDQENRTFSTPDGFFKLWNWARSNHILFGGTTQYLDELIIRLQRKMLIQTLSPTLFTTT